MNTTRFPSGENRGLFSFFGPAIVDDGCPEPSAGTDQMSALRVPLDRSVVVRTNTTVRPSGESCGSAMRMPVSRSLVVIGRPPARDCASGAEAVTQIESATRESVRIMESPAEKGPAVGHAGPWDRHEHDDERQREEDGGKPMLAAIVGGFADPGFADVHEADRDEHPERMLDGPESKTGI